MGQMLKQTGWEIDAKGKNGKITKRDKNGKIGTQVAKLVKW